MSEWKKVKLDDCLELITYGFTNPMPDTDCGPWKVTAKDIADGRINYQTARHTSIDAFENELTDKSRPVKGDLLLTKDGTLGRLAIVGDERICINQSVALLRVKHDIIYVPYLYYLLSTPLYQGKMLADVGGATIKHIYITRVNQIAIPCPSYEEQVRIATILSRYDSLIENYQKQIKLLEEAAQRLYKEWFVDLRFPGHENTKIVDGVPEGWERRTLDSFCSVFTGKKNANQGVVNGKYKFFTCGDTPLLINSYIFDGPAIIISGNGSYTGRTTFYEGKFDLYQRTYACTMRDMENQNLIYGLYEIVKCELTNKISGGTHGAAIPYIVMSDVTKFDFLFNESVMNSFSTTIKNFLSISLKFQNKIRLLTEARDRLLPKLMSGEIAV